MTQRQHWTHTAMQYLVISNTRSQNRSMSPFTRQGHICTSAVCLQGHCSSNTTMFRAMRGYLAEIGHRSHLTTGFACRDSSITTSTSCTHMRRGRGGEP